MKYLVGIAILGVICLIATMAANPDKALYPATNTITYGTNTFQLSDSTAGGLIATYNKGDLYVLTRWNSATATVAILEPVSQQLLWRGLASSVKIVGVTNTDVAKVASLTATPFK